MVYIKANNKKDCLIKNIKKFYEYILIYHSSDL